MDFHQTQWTSSSASSPFSHSTDDSSPEAIVSVGKVTPPTMQQALMGTVPGNFHEVFGHAADIKPALNGNHFGQQQQHSIPAPTAFARPPSAHQNGSSSHTSFAAPSFGAKHDKPPRRYPTDQLPLLTPPVNDLFEGDMTKGLLLLQGDPQVITKQRVETAIRVVLDFCHFVLPHLIPPPVDSALHPLLPRGPDGNFLRHLARTGTFKTLRLQAGATTKQMSKKQEQARELARRGDPHTLDQSTLYLETAVYKSDGQTRVYACKRCRQREEKRRKTKESSRKTPLTEPANGHVNLKSSLSPQPKSEQSPSPDYVTGDNADEYEPMKASQVVEEPSWDPNVPDWRHEIITFNSSPEWPFKEPGTVDWLPLRVICYGKCHGEKTGFKIRFTVRTHDGRIFASQMTDCIRITDDHKTDKAKPRTEMARSAPIARSRKGTSVMSSRRASPNLSDESQQSMSQAGAMVQKFVPSSKGNKPYDRPAGLHRHNSSSSINSAASMSAMPMEMRNQFPDIPSSSTDWSNVDHTSAFSLRQPFLGTMTPLNGDHSSLYSSNPPSVHSSARQSPLGLQEDLPLDLQGSFSGLGQSLAQQLGQLSAQQTQPQEIFQQNLSPTLYDAMNGHQFNTQDPYPSLHQSQGSIGASSYSSSYLSNSSALGLNMDGSMYSESGLPPSSSADTNEDMMNFLNFGAGDDDNTAPNIQGLPIQDATRLAQPFQPIPNQAVSPIAPAAQPDRPVPTIFTVAPNMGPLAGGLTVAIVGCNFTPEMIVSFGGRAARLDSFSSNALVLCLPPGTTPGPVEVRVQDAYTSATSTFLYNDVSQDAMALALQIGSHGLMGMQGNGNGSGMNFSASSQTNGNGNDSSNGAQTESSTAPKNLQTTLTDYIASLDEHSPGSLRTSGAINTRNDAQQTLVHLASILGYDQLLKHIIVSGAQLDLVDANGFTALAFAAHFGQIACARELIRAGATYDIATNMGEVPLDLAEKAGNAAIGQLFLSAVWKTTASLSTALGPAAKDQERDLDEGGISASEVEDAIGSDGEDDYAVESDIELDRDNPSDGSDDEVDAFITTAPERRSSKHKSSRPRVVAPANLSVRGNAPTSVRNSLSEEVDSGDESEASDFGTFRRRPAARLRRNPSSHSVNKAATAPSPEPQTAIDTPPPYSLANWRDRFPLTEQWKIPIVPQPFAAMFHPRAAEAPTDGAWITLPISTPSWETLQKLTSPEEVKAFTQAMTASALNAIVSSGATTATTPGTSTQILSQRPKKKRSGRRSSGSGSASAKAANPSPAQTTSASTGLQLDTGAASVSTPSSVIKAIKPIKRDRMLFYFWLPLLLFFGFWTIIAILPIFTGIGLYYARTIRQVLKQRL